MAYSEKLVPVAPEERKKLMVTLLIIIALPIVLAAAGFLLNYFDYFWGVFLWVAAGFTLAFLVIPHTVRLVKDDFYSHKILYKGTLKELRPVTVGVGTNSSILYELVLENKTLKVSEKGLNQLKLPDVPLPSQGEEVEIHALPKSGDIMKLLVSRNGKWEEVGLI